MRAEHTPGPWEVVGFGPGRMFEIRAHGKTIYLVMPAQMDYACPADASLIVASPRLLSMLERCFRSGALPAELADEVGATIATAIAPLPSCIVR